MTDATVDCYWNCLLMVQQEPWKASDTLNEGLVFLYFLAVVICFAAGAVGLWFTLDRLRRPLGEGIRRKAVLVVLGIIFLVTWPVFTFIVLPVTAYWRWRDANRVEEAMDRYSRDTP